MNSLEGRVALITGAGRGIGREHALRFADEGACVAVADVAGADEVAQEIAHGGGRAVAAPGDVSSWTDAHVMVQTAIDAFGRLDALVNNAAINRDGPFAQLGEDDWDDVVRIDLKGTFCPTKAAVTYWLAEEAAGRPVRASVTSTSSGAGLFGNVGASAYGAAKAGVAAFTVILAKELAEHGIRVNAIAPAARSPMSSVNPVVAAYMAAPDDPGAFDAWHAANVSPLVAYLATEGCDVSGEVFHVRGGTISRFEPWCFGPTLTSNGPWTVDELARRVPEIAARETAQEGEQEAAYAELRHRLREDQLARARGET